MWKLTELLAQELTARGITVIKTRSNQATDLALTSRGKKAKGCDLFLSMHSNATSVESVDYPVSYVPLNGTGTAIGQKLSDIVADVMGTVQKGRTATRKGSGGADYYGVIRGAVAVGVPGVILEHSFHTHSRSTAWLLEDENLHRLAAAEAALLAEYYGMEEKKLRYELLKDIQDKILRGKGGCGEETIIDLSEDALRLLVILDRAGLFPS